jgi:hypothetical protein
MTRSPFYVVLHDDEVVARNIQRDELSAVLEFIGGDEYVVHRFDTIGQAEYWVTTWEAK